MALTQIGRRLLAGANSLVRRWGYHIDVSRTGSVASDFSQEQVELYRSVQPYTMTSIERISAVCDAVEYVVRNRIRGDFVECGVWRGGATMAAAKTFLRLGDVSRLLWLYDTFAGMSEPGASEDPQIHARWRQLNREDRNDWCCASLNDVQQNLATTGYPSERLQFVAGKVEDTIPDTMPAHIAILRLDTDWHDSTAWELKHLYPLLSPGGVLIIDDYGHWSGSRKAVDDYLQVQGINPLLCRTDYTGRMCIKTQRDFGHP